MSVNGTTVAVGPGQYMYQVDQVTCNLTGCNGTCGVCRPRLTVTTVASTASARHGDPRFYALLEEIADLHSRKNHDYARADEPLSNFRKAEALGVEAWRGVLVRMSDKWSRIEELSKGKVAKNESMRDSLIDLAVYALIDVLLLEDAGR